jgi:hypothetical protein
MGRDKKKHSEIMQGYVWEDGGRAPVVDQDTGTVQRPDDEGRWLK